MDSTLSILAAAFLAAFTQSLTGFGSALVTMAFLPTALGIRTAQPLVALFAGTLEAFLFLRYRAAFNLSAVWRLLVGAIIAIPLGIAGARVIDEHIVLTLLGLLLMGYPLYALFTPRLPQVPDGKLTFGAGFAAGLLGGAYNTSGPPVILYGDNRRWSPQEFKANLQGFFLLNDMFTLAGHALGGTLTPLVWQHFGLILPALFLGLLAGLALDRVIPPTRFRQIVLVLLIALGARMIITATLG